MKKFIFILLILLLNLNLQAQIPKVKAIDFKTITTSQRDALIVDSTTRSLIFNSTLDVFQIYNGSNWIDLDFQNVKLTGPQSIAGEKQFTDSVGFSEDLLVGGDIDVNGSIGTNSNISALTITPSSITTGNIPYKSAGALLDSPISTDGSDITVIGSVIAIDSKLGGSTSTETLGVHNSNRPYIHLTSDSTGKTVADGTFIGFLSTNGALEIRNKENQPINFKTDDIQALTLASNQSATFASSISATDGIFSGNTYFGTTATPNGTSVYGSAFISESNDRSKLIMSTSTASNSGLIDFNNANGLVGNITTNGSTTAYNTSSDYRLKEDLKDFNGLEMISNIPVYDYKWKVDDTRSFGVMAHELQAVLPNAVSGEKDATEQYEVSPKILDEEGNIIEEAVFAIRNVSQGVDYSKIVPLLIKSIQELKAEIELLKNN
jgi:hypothetical protein